jgi:Lipopolysaccharide kinase (Kdo/WaaP) family
VPTPQPFTFESYRGELAAEVSPTDLGPTLARLVDPGAAEATLHWGRNLLYRSTFEAATERAIPCVVKLFRHMSLRARLDRGRRGSKAERSWRAAQQLVAAGFDTARPLAWIESQAPDGPAWFVTELLAEVTEARYLLRAARTGSAAVDFPQFPLDEFLVACAGLARRLHDAGIWFRDFTSGNVLLRREADGSLRLFLVDLNRARFGRPPTLSERTRDLSRMPIFRPEDQEVFLNAYWAQPVSALQQRLYRLYHRAFHGRHEWKKRLRGQKTGKTPRGSTLKGRLVGRSTHEHIPSAPAGAEVRDRIVWDALSDQPHVHASPLTKLGVRLREGRGYVAETLAAGWALPRIWRRHCGLRRELYHRPVPFLGAGVAVRPWPQDPDGLLALVDELGCRTVLVRLHPWEPEGRDDEEALVRALRERDLEVAFAVPQNRDLVKDLDRWEAEITDIARRFTVYGRHFQVGQAVNRSKWGVWAVDEYVELARRAGARLKAARQDVQVLGPAVIDFEYHRTAGLLNLRRKGFHFDAVSALLYVDRRGAPENPQMGLDTVGKVTLLRALADTARNSDPGPVWLTEVNWPLLEGPHSPAGKSVSVDEESQADYLVRYYLLALGTGLVARAYWWQMIARGYGLVCPEADELRRRPSFRAFRTLLGQLGGASFLGPVPTLEPGRLYHFRRSDGGELIVGWSAGRESLPVTLPRPAREIIERDGDRRGSAGPIVEIGPSPRYFELG